MSREPPAAARLALRLALFLAACDVSPPPPPPPPPPTPSTSAPAAPCILPAARPPDLRVRLHQSIVPHGALPHTEGLILRETCAADADAPCRTVTPQALTDLYQHLREAGFADLGRDSAGAASPHYGSRSITLDWGGGEAGEHCTVSDASHRMLPTDEQPRFRALWDAILVVPAAE